MPRRTKEQKFGRQTGYAAAKARKMKADARLAELLMEEREGKLVPVDAVLALEQLRGSDLRSAIVAFPGKWAPRGVGLKTIPEVQAHYETIANEILENLSQTGTRIRDRLVASRNRTAPAAPRRGRPRGPRAKSPPHRRGVG